MPDTERAKTMIPPSLQTEGGTLSLKKLLSKGISPTTITALIAALASFYAEYQDLKMTVADQETEIEELRVRNDNLNDRLDEYVHTSATALRDRFEQGDHSVATLRNALGNLQTEVRVRHGAQSFMPPALASVSGPRARVRREDQIEAAAIQSDEAYGEARREPRGDDPLLALEDL